MGPGVAGRTSAAAENLCETFKETTPTGFYLTCTVEQETVDFLVDCGSALTIISEDVWKKIDGKQKGKLNKGPQAFSVNNQRLTVLGYVRTKLAFGKWVVSHEVCVVKDLNNHGILGLDFLSRHGGIVDLQNGF